MSEVVNIASSKLVGIQATGPSSFNKELSGNDFGATLWQELIRILKEENISVQRKMYGVSWPADELTPPGLIHYFVGFEITGEKMPSTFVELNLEGGKYLKYRYRGPSSEVDSGFIKAYMEELPNSGLQGREGQHLEIYEADLDLSNPEITFGILIPVK